MITLQRLNVVKIVDSKFKAELLQAKGFKVIDEAKKEKTLNEMTVAELEEYAIENNIDLTGLSNKSEKLAKIKEVMGGK